MSGGGWFLHTLNYPPIFLRYLLANGLVGVRASSVDLYSRVIDHTRMTCLALSRGGEAGDTWCVVPTGQFAYFTSDSRSSQSGVKELVLTRISRAVPASTFVLPAVPTGPT